jgi:hypothetical protein
MNCLKVAAPGYYFVTTCSQLPYMTAIKANWLPTMPVIRPVLHLLPLYDAPTANNEA